MSLYSGRFPRCAICQKSVDLMVSKTDENGRAVHENCYVWKLLSSQPAMKPTLRSSLSGFPMNSVKVRGMEIRDRMKLLVLRNLRPQVCYILALLRIHSPECKHCIARHTCGDDLRKRLEELDGRTRPSLHENQDHQSLRRVG